MSNRWIPRCEGKSKTDGGKRGTSAWRKDSPRLDLFRFRFDLDEKKKSREREREEIPSICPTAIAPFSDLTKIFVGFSRL